MNVALLSTVVIIYMVITALLGYLGWRRTKTSKDYLVAGRQTHPMIMAISYGATFISTSAIVGFGGVAGLFGMGLLWLTVLNIFVGIFIAFVFIGKRVRRMGHNLDAHTFPEFLGNRYKSPWMQKLSGLFVFLGMPLYSAVVLIGGAKFMELTLGLSFFNSVMIFSLIVGVYVFMGGLKGVMYTDALQGGIMFVGMAILLVATYMKLGGIVEAHTALTNLGDLVPDKLRAMGHVGWTSMPTLGSPFWWTLVTSLVMGVGIGVLAQPQLMVRFMTVKSDRELNRAVLAGGVFIFFMTFVAFVVGALSNVFFHNTTGLISIAAAKGNADAIIPLYINQAMPQWFVYVFMLTLLAAAMSTLSSQFHVMGTSIGRDFIEKILKLPKHSLLINRLAILFSVILSVVIALKLPENIIAPGTAIFFALAAATFLPAYLGAIYWKGATKTGAMSSMVVGALTSLVWLVFFHKKEAVAFGICNALFGKETFIMHMPWPVIDPMIIALPLSTLVMILISLLTKKLEEKSIKAAFNGIK
jgi:SSS family solute:Na+ symporter